MSKKKRSAVNDYIEAKLEPQPVESRTASPEALRQSMPNPDGEPRYIRGPKFRPLFGRLLTPDLTKAIAEGKTFDMDIRPVLEGAEPVLLDDPKAKDAS